jgi:hypothetical protein
MVRKWSTVPISLSYTTPLFDEDRSTCKPSAGGAWVRASSASSSSSSSSSSASRLHVAAAPTHTTPAGGTASSPTPLDITMNYFQKWNNGFNFHLVSANTGAAEQR